MNIIKIFLQKVILFRHFIVLLISILVLIEHEAYSQKAKSGGSTASTKEYKYNTKYFKKASFIEKKILKSYDRMLKSTVGIGVPETGASGVIISEDGYILTAAHVMKALDYKDGKIRLYDGNVVTATCLDRNNNADYGLMKIKEKRKWTYAELGTSSDMVKDQACIMLGHPEVYDPKRSPVVQVGFYKGATTFGYMKTSCIMMPGNSGGHLFDTKGRVIGICSYIRKGVLDENYYPAIDRIKDNMERLEFGEVFEDAREDETAYFQEATAGQSSYAIEGGKASLKLVFRELSKQVSNSVVKIQSKINGQLVDTYGTIINRKGYIVSKSSRVGEDSLIGKLATGEKLQGEIVGRDKDNDIAVIKLSSQKSFSGIDLDGGEAVLVGKLVGTVGCNQEVLHAGIVSVGTREVKNHDKGYLGIKFESSKPTISQVPKGTPADKAGLIVGDVLLSFDDQSVSSRQDVYKFLRGTMPEQELHIKVLRSDQEVKLNAVLGKFVKEPKAWKKEHPAFLTKESKRQDGFPSVFTHDMPLLLDECGTPVVNLKGQVIGINIARKNRPSAYAVPLNTVKRSVNSIMDKAGTLE